MIKGYLYFHVIKSLSVNRSLCFLDILELNGQGRCSVQDHGALNNS